MNIKQIVKEIFSRIKQDWYLPVTEYQRYSSEEIVIGEYMGKPLYRKTIIYPNSITYGNVVVELADLTSCNIDRFISYKGVCDYASDKGNQFVIPFCNTRIGMSTLIFYNVANKMLTLEGYRGDGATTTILNTKVTIEYTKTTDSPIQSKVTFEPLVEYSFDEKMIGYWIGGEPLYRKTVDCGALPNNSQKNIAHGISDLGEVISINGKAYRPTDKMSIPLPFSQSDAGSSVGILEVSGNIRITTGMDRSAFVTSYVTLEYTKTTD